MPNRRKRKRVKLSSVEKTYYYPLYNGYSYMFLQHPHIFEHQSHAAAWGISRFKKDGLSNVWGEGNYPYFLNYVGMIKPRRAIISRGNNLLCVQNSRQSHIENMFFEDVTFYKLDCIQKLLRKECGYVKLCNDVYAEVTGCFKTKPDYMLSSNSIYKSEKLKAPDYCSVYDHDNFCNLLNQKMASSKDGIIRIEDYFRYFSDENKIRSQDKMLAQLVTKYASSISRNLKKKDRVIVSIGSGRAETEIQSGELCVCLDKDTKSLYTCAFASKYLWKERSNIVFLHYDLKDGILNLLSAIKGAVSLPVVALFQHPSPSKANKNRVTLKSTFWDCVLAKEQNIVESIHFVYDSKSETKANFWKEKELFQVLKSMCSEDKKHKLTEPSVISEKGNAEVKHPLFGLKERRGWAKLKGGVEMSFSVI